MMNYEYGYAWKDHNVETGTVVFDDGSKLKTHDIMDPLPAFMKDADLIFTDSPWNTGNLRTFYTKADMITDLEFEKFYSRLFECVKAIHPKTCYLEIGKQFLADFIMEMRKVYRHVTFFNSSYYHKADNHCYVVRGSDRPKAPHLDGMDEEDIIAWVCANEDYDCIGDLCMGQGLVAVGAYKAEKRFVGTELNHKRLSVTVKNLVTLGAKYEIINCQKEAQNDA